MDKSIWDNAPVWATRVIGFDDGGKMYFTNDDTTRSQAIGPNKSGVFFEEPRPPAEIRGPGWVRVCTNESEQHSKYHREIKPGVFVDVYDFIEAFEVKCPALQHLIKKALAPGQRGHKDRMTDLNDILASAKRAIELERARCARKTTP